MLISHVQSLCYVDTLLNSGVWINEVRVCEGLLLCCITWYSVSNLYMQAENPAGMPGANNQLYGARLNRAHLVAAQQARDAVVQHQAAAEGAGGTEGHVASPLDLQGPLNELVGMLQRVLDFLPGEGSDGYDSTDSNDR